MTSANTTLAFESRALTKLSPNTIAGWILTLYLGFSPVYWLPQVSPNVLAVLKLIMVGSGVTLIFLNGLASGKLRLPVGLLGPQGIIVLMLSASGGFFQAELGAALSRSFDFLLGFVFLWAFYNFARAGGNYVQVFGRAAMMIVGFSAVTLISGIFGFPNWYSPFSSAPGLLEPLASTGFGAGRTGWSNGIALFLPLALGFTILRPRQRFIRRTRVVAFAIVCVAIVGTQIVTGGRAGLVASLLALLGLTFSSTSRKAALIIVVIASFVGFVLSDYLVDQLRITRLSASTITVNELDSFSAGRISGYLLAGKLISERPLTGYGFERVELRDYGISYTHIHNLWLRMAVDAGVLLPIAFLFLVTALFRACWKSYRAHTLETYLRPTTPRAGRLVPTILTLVLVEGVVISLFEPNVLLGTFQNSAVWWGAGGVMLAELRRRAALLKSSEVKRQVSR